MFLEQLNTSINFIVLQTQAHLALLTAILSLLWGIFFLNKLLHNQLLYLGIIPRRLYGLPGIIFAPFLHANFNHLFFNSIPLLVLSNFVLLQGLSNFLIVTLLITLLSGLLIWCFGKPGIHLGASAVISGYWGFLVSGIYHEGTLTAFILGALSLYYFAGIFLGIFPRDKGVSWEGHLFGLVAGFATSYLSRYNFAPLITLAHCTSWRI